jgi:hypothetical protein
LNGRNACVVAIFPGCMCVCGWVSHCGEGVNRGLTPHRCERLAHLRESATTLMNDPLADRLAVSPPVLAGDALQ